MSDSVRKLVKDALLEIIDSASNGGTKTRIGLLSSGSELGSAEMIRGASLATARRKDIEVVMIGPKVEGSDLPWIETDSCEESISEAMEKALGEGTVAGVVALHYPFPVGVTTIGRVITPGRGKEMLIASSTGTSSPKRVNAMVMNAVYAIAAAKAIGWNKPTIGILNVDGAQTVLRILKKMKDNGYDFEFGSSARADGGAVLRGNDILSGAVDICVCDTLTGNVLMKMFSAFTTGGSYESCGYGYGPSVGDGYGYVVSIISRASGSPVIAGAIEYTADAVKGNIRSKVKSELSLARKAGLDSLLQELDAKAAPTEKTAEIIAPPSIPTDDELHGLDVLVIEDAVRVLWKNDVYAESAMGCTGPVIKIGSAFHQKAEEILKGAGYL